MTTLRERGLAFAQRMADASKGADQQEELRMAALRELDWLEGYMGHQVFEDGSDGWDHFIPIRRALEGAAPVWKRHRDIEDCNTGACADCMAEFDTPTAPAWRCDWVPDDLNPGPECPYCAGQMCARFDGLGCTHDREERHGYADGGYSGGEVTPRSIDRAGFGLAPR